MINPAIRSMCWEFATSIADELERSDQPYLEFRSYGYGVQVSVRLAARDMIARYVRRAIEADRKARSCAEAE